MAIISAGVIMNLLLALGCFTYGYMSERDELSAVLGAVSAGSVAYEAGLRGGDEVVAIDDRPVHGIHRAEKKTLYSARKDRFFICGSGARSGGPDPNRRAAAS